MRPRPRSTGLALSLLLLALLPGIPRPASAAEISPHRALYSLTLDKTTTSPGVVSAQGAMYYEWGETCEGWTVEQRFRLHLTYAESEELDMTSALVTWESKDGLRYRFNERRTRSGEPDEQIKGEARLEAGGKGGVAEFSKPEVTRVELPASSIFPTAHTILLIDRAAAGDVFLARPVFDGAAVETSTQVTAAIGKALRPEDRRPDEALAPRVVKSPLLQRPSWRVRLAFFPASNGTAEQPEYELGMRLLDNGVSQDLLLDYTDYIIRGTLDRIEALPKPAC